MFSLILVFSRARQPQNRSGFGIARADGLGQSFYKMRAGINLQSTQPAFSLDTLGFVHDVASPYGDVPGATSPWPVSMTKASEFFGLRR
jgi:hypothetical protein